MDTLNKGLSFKIIKVLIYALSIIATFSCLLPVYVLLVNSTHSTTTILQKVSLLPGSDFFNNLERITVSEFNINIWGAMVNSLIVASSASILCIYVSSLTAYAIKLYTGAPGNKFVFRFILAIMMVPAQITLVGLYKYMSALGLLNTYVPLIFPAIVAPSTIFFVKQYLDSVMQISIIEAARIDGASEFSIFNKIMLPIMAPAVATMGLLAFIVNWNSYLIPSLIITDMSLYTIPLTTVLFNFNNITPDYGARYAVLVISLLPIIAVYIATGKHIINGIAIGGVKE